MKVVDFNNYYELCVCLGKKCHFVFDKNNFKHSVCEAILTKIEFDTHSGSTKIFIEFDEISISIPVKSISSMSTEE